jgi:hypothetical protein
MDNNKAKPQQQKRRRARKPDGKFQGDNPSTPDLNEAWEPTDVAEVVTEKEVKYTVKQRVTGTSEASAGKYAKKQKVRPTFGNVTTTYH